MIIVLEIIVTTLSPKPYVRPQLYYIRTIYIPPKVRNIDALDPWVTWSAYSKDLFDTKVLDYLV